jgi:hypothetical protein
VTKVRLKFEEEKENLELDLKNTIQSLEKNNISYKNEFKELTEKYSNLGRFSLI